MQAEKRKVNRQTEDKNLMIREVNRIIVKQLNLVKFCSGGNLSLAVIIIGETY